MLAAACFCVYTCERLYGTGQTPVCGHSVVTVTYINMYSGARLQVVYGSDNLQCLLDQSQKVSLETPVDLKLLRVNTIVVYSTILKLVYQV